MGTVAIELLSHANANANTPIQLSSWPMIIEPS